MVVSGSKSQGHLTGAASRNMKSQASSFHHKASCLSSQLPASIPGPAIYSLPAVECAFETVNQITSLPGLKLCNKHNFYGLSSAAFMFSQVILQPSWYWSCSYDSQLTDEEAELKRGLPLSPRLTWGTPPRPPAILSPIFPVFSSGISLSEVSIYLCVYRLPVPSRIQDPGGEGLCLAFSLPYSQCLNEAWHRVGAQQKSVQ